MSQRPLVSLIIGGKNDNYQEKWVERFEYTLNYNLFSLSKTNNADRVEINIVDFCSEDKIRNNLNLISSKTHICIHELTSKKEPSPDYHLGISLNTGLERATGEYCIIMGSDQFMTATIWQNLISHLEVERLFPKRKSLYRLIPRKQLPHSFKFDRINFEQAEQVFEGLSHTNFGYRNMKAALGAGAGGLLATKETFEAVNYFDTNWGGYGGQDNEISNKISNLYGHIDLSQFGIFMYKLPYAPGGRIKKISQRADDKQQDPKDFGVKSFEPKKKASDTYHAERVNAKINNDLQHPLPRPNLKSAINTAFILNSYKVFKGDLREFWILSQYLSGHLKSKPFLDLITTSQTAIFSLSALGQKNNLTNNHVFLSSPLEKLKPIDLYFRCILRLGHIGYVRAIETKKIDLKNFQENVPIERLSLVLIDSATIAENDGFLELLINNEFIFEIAIIGKMSEKIRQHYRISYDLVDLNEDFSFIQKSNSYYRPNLYADNFLQFLIFYYLLKLATITMKKLRWTLKPLRRPLKFIYNLTQV